MKSKESWGAFQALVDVTLNLSQVISVRLCPILLLQNTRFALKLLHACINSSEPYMSNLRYHKEGVVQNNIYQRISCSILEVLSIADDALGQMSRGLSHQLCLKVSFPPLPLKTKPTCVIEVIGNTTDNRLERSLKE